jgi:hypothetical protein
MRSPSHHVAATSLALALSAAAGAGIAAPLTAQASPARPAGSAVMSARAPERGARGHGVWATIGAGRGDLRINCDICRPADQSSWSAHVAIGGSVGAHAKVGGELGAWRHGDDDATLRAMLIGAVAQLYPSRTMPAFVKLGAGVMNFEATDAEESLGARSVALQAGFGWDIRVGRGLVAVPYATLVQGFNRGLELNDERITGSSQVKLVQFGLGVGVR